MERVLGEERGGEIEAGRKKRATNKERLDVKGKRMDECESLIFHVVGPLGRR